MKFLLLFLVSCLSFEITKLSFAEVYLGISINNNTKIHTLPNGCSNIFDSGLWKCGLIDRVNTVWVFTKDADVCIAIHYGDLNDSVGLSISGKGVHEIILNQFSSHNESIVIPTYTGRETSHDNFVMIYFYLGSNFK